MNLRIFQTFGILLLVFLLKNNLPAQCSSIPCTIPVPAVDARNACILPNPAALNCYRGALSTDSPISFPPSWCVTLENNHCFAFIADSTTVLFKLCTDGCEPAGGIQAAILSTLDCINFEFVSPCLGNIITGTCEELIATNLNVGSVYYLMLDGYAGWPCGYSINADNCPSATLILNETVMPDLIIYPNPVSTFTNEITVELPRTESGECTFIVTDLMGQGYFRKNEMPFSGKTTLEIGSLPTGTYHVQALMEGKMVARALFIKV